MASLKEIKSRIGSVKNTRKITSAMRMVASAKLHRAQGVIENLLPYQKRMDSILNRFLSNNPESINSPYTLQREVKKVTIVAFSSNTSMNGAFNANIIKALGRAVDEYQSLGKDNIRIYPIGKKVEDAAIKQGFKPCGSYQEMAKKPSYEAASQLAEELMKSFLSGETDKIELIYYHFKTAGSQELIRRQFLPIELNNPEFHQEEQATNIDYIVEPSVPEFIADLLPQVLRLNLYAALADSAASEHASRTMAMQTATDNANELIDELSKQYNKSRQQAITNELLDIVGGSMK